MSAVIIRFPARGPFQIRVMREAEAWLVVCRDHVWLHGDRAAALQEARQLAEGWRVTVEVLP
jgi:hypothetical protein